MAVAAPKRRSASQTAPAPSRTAPPEPKKRPRDRPRPGSPGRSAAAAPATKPARKPAPKRSKGTSARKAAAAATRDKGATARTAAARASAAAGTARTAPARKAAPRRRTGARVIPIAAGTAGRAAVAVTQLPESGLIHRLTRGRAWIGVLGVLLVGIVALNVVTLSFAASSGEVEARNQELSKENSVLQSQNSRVYGQGRLHAEAKQLGLSAMAAAAPTTAEVDSGDVATAASRLAAAAAGATAASPEGEASAGEEAAGSEEAAGAEEVPSGEEITETELAGLTQEEKNAIYEQTLAREAAEAEGVSGETVTYEEPAYGETVTEVLTE
jgi:hypothetical protein